MRSPVFEDVIWHFSGHERFRAHFKQNRLWYEAVVLRSGRTYLFAFEGRISRRRTKQLGGDASPDVGWSDEVEGMLAAVR